MIVDMGQAKFNPSALPATVDGDDMLDQPLVVGDIILTRRWCRWGIHTVSFGSKTGSGFSAPAGSRNRDAGDFPEAHQRAVCAGY